MSTLMMPAPAMTTMSTPGPLQVATNKLEPTAKLSMNHNNATGNKAGTTFFFFSFAMMMSVLIYIFLFIYFYFLFFFVAFFFARV